MSNVDKMIEMAKEAYIKVYGVDRWNGLTGQQKHDAVMFIWKDFAKAVGV